MLNADEVNLLVADLLEAVLFDPETCDFGPVYGLRMQEEKEVIRRARKYLKAVEFARPKPVIKRHLSRTGKGDIGIFD